jgi:hypothetical protein
MPQEEEGDQNMRKININRIARDIEDKAQIFGNVLGPLGNNNIRSYHIGYFRSQLLEKNEHQKAALASCPNYYAWVVIYAEHVFWLLRQFCYNHNNLQEPKVFTSDYNKLMRVFWAKCAQLPCYTEAEIKAVFAEIVTVLIFRHSVVHGGFPNVFPATLAGLKDVKKPTRTKGDPQREYSEAEVQAVVTCYADSRNFVQIDGRFASILQFLEKAGSVQISV